MRNCFLIIACFICVKLDAQNKLSFDLNLGVLGSIGKDIAATHVSANGIVHYDYYSREKFINPYLSFLGHVQYNFNSRLAAGIESGVYYHFSEIFSARKVESLVAIPLRLTLNRTLFKLNSKPAGVEVAFGGLFFTVTNGFEFKMHNALIYNAAFFYKISKKHALMLGLEKERDRTRFYYRSDDPAYPDDMFKTHINRVGVTFSYRIFF